MKLLIMAGLFFLASTSLSFPQPAFGPPVNLGYPINTAYFEADPFLTADGKKLFFASDRLSGFGQEDIWFSEWTGTN